MVAGEQAGDDFAIFQIADLRAAVLHWLMSSAHICCWPQSVLAELSCGSRVPPIGQRINFIVVLINAKQRVLMEN